MSNRPTTAYTALNRLRAEGVQRREERAEQLSKASTGGFSAVLPNHWTYAGCALRLVLESREEETHKALALGQPDFTSTRLHTADYSVVRKAPLPPFPLL